MMDKKLKSELQPIKNDLKNVKNNLENVKNDIKQVKLFQENTLLPRLDHIESCYTDTYNRYKNYADKMEAAFDDIELLKKVVSEHSQKLQNIS